MKSRLPARHSLLAVGSLSALLVGCATTPPPAPKFDAQADARAQAANFIADNGKTQYLSQVGKVAVTGCNVLFAQTSSASAGTEGGLFSTAGGVSRAESKVSVYYTLDGISAEQLQAMANEICADADTRLKNAGWDVVPKSALLADEAFIALMGAGKASPFEFKSPAQNSKTVYQVFTPSGYSVYDPRYIGTASGLGQAFKAAAGNSAAQHEARVMKNFGASAVNINVLVDFAALTSDGGQEGLRMASKDSAEVTHGVNLGITGAITIKPDTDMKCWERFGKQECAPDFKRTVEFTSKNPVTTGEPFYKQVVNTTTTGDKVAAGFTKALSVLAAVGGISGVSSQDTTRYSVEVEPAQFKQVSRKGIDGFLDMAFLSAKVQP